MHLEALRLYLVEGLKTRSIADRLEITHAKTRGLLGQQGLRVREVGRSLRDSGREPVCAAVAWKGYKSFHEFITKNHLKPISEQAAMLGVPKKAFGRIYDLYRSLLEQLQSAGRDIHESTKPGESTQGSHRGADRGERSEV